MMALTPGKPLTVPAGEHEYFVLLLSGGCTVQASGERLEVAGRESVFIDIINYVYVPHRTEVTLTNVDGTHIALPGSKATTDKPPRYCPRSEVGTGLQEVSLSSRQVNNYALGNDVETSHLLACEVLTPRGNWSSCPPHKHNKHTEVGRVLGEVYYYQARAGEGDAKSFMLQRIYSSPGHDIDVCTGVRGGDIIVMPRGCRGPSMVTPDYNLHYLNIIASPAENSVQLMTDDPHHTWVHQTQEGREVDPRLPMTPMSDQPVRLSTAPPPEKGGERPR